MDDLYIKSLRGIPLFRIVHEYATEFGWIKEKEFRVFIPYDDFSSFMAELKENFGQFMTEPFEINAVIENDMVSINLCDLLPETAVSIEEVFSKEHIRRSKWM